MQCIIHLFSLINHILNFFLFLFNLQCARDGNGDNILLSGSTIIGGHLYGSIGDLATEQITKSNRK